MKSKFILFASALLVAGSVDAQTKKVILEDFTGRWCQYCPNGSKGIADMDVTHPANFLAVASHNDNSASIGGPNDPLEIKEGAEVAVGIGVTGFPTGAIDRKLLTGSKIPIGIDATAAAWKSNVTARLATTAIASVGFTNLKMQTDGTYEGDIIVKFTDLPEAGVPLAVQVYILEDHIEATVANGLRQTNSTTHYGGGNPLTSANGFYHDHTLRMALGGTWGWTDVIPSTVERDKDYVKHFSFKIPATAVPQPWVADKVNLYGFVSYNGTAAADKKEILNAEKTKLSAFFPASVKNVNTVKITNAYPNPARLTDVINVEYTAPESGHVSMKVINPIGQVVAEPYNSYEVKGTHTILWRASEHGLAAGTYMLAVTTAEGTTVQKINIY